MIQTEANDCRWNHFIHRARDKMATMLQTSYLGVFSSWWRHQMETFSALLAICAGNSSVTGEFPAQRPVARCFYVSFICTWIFSWVNNREADDLRRHRAHYDVTVMLVEHLAFLLKNQLNLIIRCPIDNESASAQVMAWCWRSSLICKLYWLRRRRLCELPFQRKVSC